MPRNRQPKKDWEAARPRSRHYNQEPCQRPQGPNTVVWPLPLTSSHVDSITGGKVASNTNTNVDILCWRGYGLSPANLYRDLISGVHYDSMIPPDWRPMLFLPVLLSLRGKKPEVPRQLGDFIFIVKERKTCYLLSH